MARFPALLVVFAAFVLTGCASSGYGPSEEWRLRNLEEKFLEFQESQYRQSERIAALDEAVEELSEDIRELPARVDAKLEAPEPDDVSPETREALAMYREMFEAAESQGEESPTEEDLSVEPEPKPESADEEAEPAGKWDEYPSVEAKKEPEPEPERPREPEKQTAAKASEPAEGYRKGLSLVRGDDPAKGRAVLESFVQSRPQDDLVPNALYWIGESYYNEERFDRAILAFKEVYRRFPDHPKAAAALLKTAYSYQKLGDEKNARFYLTVLLEDFPDAEPAALARKKMSELGD